MSEYNERREDGVEALRSRMDADARFHRVLSGYDPDEVREYLENVKRVFSQQAKAARQEQESLISDLNAAKSEIHARNCAIKTIKDTLDQRESELTSMQARTVGLTQSIRSLEAERAGIEQLRVAAASARVAAERAQALEKEVQQLRSTLSQAANVIESWKAERTQLLDENARLRAEIESLRIKGVSAGQAYEPSRTSPAPAWQTGAERQTNESASVMSRETEGQIPSQIADKLADTFAEAYALVNQLRTGTEPPRGAPQQRSAPSRVQVLRPDGTIADYSISGK